MKPNWEADGVFFGKLDLSDEVIVGTTILSTSCRGNAHRRSSESCPSTFEHSYRKHHWRSTRRSLKSLKSFSRDSSPGQDGCTYEHLKVLMDDVDAFELLYEISEALTTARLTALTKKDGGVRGIATCCSLRRLTARTLAKRFAKDFEANDCAHSWMTSCCASQGRSGTCMFFRRIVAEEASTFTKKRRVWKQKLHFHR